MCHCKLIGPQKCPLMALKYLNPLIFFWPSVKGHSLIAEEMPQILASGFVSLYFFGTVTTVGLFFPWIFFTVQSTQPFYTSGKGQLWGQKQYVPALCHVWLNGLLFQKEPRTRKQTNRIPHKHKFGVKLETTHAHINVFMCIWNLKQWMFSYFELVESLPVCSGCFIYMWFWDLHLDFPLFEDV